MKTSLSDTLFSFAVALAASARVFTIRQLSTHPRFSDLSQPQLRARQFLWRNKDTFEPTQGAGNESWLWRLTSKTKREFGYTFKSIAGDTQRREHWLGLGDLWLALTYAAGRPERWQTEPQAQFDVDFTWQGERALVEYQRTIISPKRWREKWDKRYAWYTKQKFDTEPFVILIVTTEQSDKAIGAPPGTLICRSVEDVPRKLRRVIHGA